jgi:hypothetical protein
MVKRSHMARGAQLPLDISLKIMRRFRGVIVRCRSVSSEQLTPPSNALRRWLALMFLIAVGLCFLAAVANYFLHFYFVPHPVRAIVSSFTLFVLLALLFVPDRSAEQRTRVVAMRLAEQEYENSRDPAERAAEKRKVAKAIGLSSSDLGS